MLQIKKLGNTGLLKVVEISVRICSSSILLIAVIEVKIHEIDRVDVGCLEVEVLVVEVPVLLLQFFDPGSCPKLSYFLMHLTFF